MRRAGGPPADAPEGHSSTQRWRRPPAHHLQRGRLLAPPGDASERAQPEEERAPRPHGALAGTEAARGGGRGAGRRPREAQHQARRRGPPPRRTCRSTRNPWTAPPLTVATSASWRDSAATNAAGARRVATCTSSLPTITRRGSVFETAPTLRRARRIGRRRPARRRRSPGSPPAPRRRRPPPRRARARGRRPPRGSRSRSRPRARRPSGRSRGRPRPAPGWRPRPPQDPHADVALDRVPIGAAHEPLVGRLRGDQHHGPTARARGERPQLVLVGGDAGLDVRVHPGRPQDRGHRRPGLGRARTTIGTGAGPASARAAPPRRARPRARGA